MLRAKRRSVVAVKRGKPECFKWPCVHHFSHQRSDLMTRKIFRRGIRGSSSIFLGRCCRICSFPTVIPIATRTMTLRRLLSNEIVSTDLVGTAMRTAAAAAAAKEWAPGVHCAAKAAESRPRSFPIQSQMNFDIQPTLFKRETRGISLFFFIHMLQRIHTIPKVCFFVQKFNQYENDQFEANWGYWGDVATSNLSTK